MIWFTLGNISVVGTYTTPEQSLTPRGLLAAAAAAAAACAAAASCTVPYSFSRWDGYSCGGLSLPNTRAALVNILATAASSCQLAAYPRGQLQALQLPAYSFQDRAAAALAAVILLVNRYLIVT